MSAYHDILRKTFGYSEFRGIQEQIIESIGSGNDTLGLMPTGGGKSLTFQIPALAMEGVCVVVTPLIALMKDQVQHLRMRGIQAAAVYSGMTHDDILKTLENAVHGGVKILYVSPERLSSALFQKKLSHMKVCFFTVDEAHCISQWGYDFRPAYLEISEIRKIHPNAPILALTATATPAVVDDIQKQLSFRKECVFSMSFRRDNLAYIVRNTEDKLGEMIHILNSVSGSAIVYVRSRKRTKEIAELLESNGISATFFHAGLDNAVKDQRQEDWQNDDVRVMVATNAFGMGIDKPDVKVVIHIDLPDSIEEYFQEAGRAGRNGQKSYAVMLYNNGDKSKLKRRTYDNFPKKETIRDIYDHLAYFYQVGIYSGKGYSVNFDIDKFSHVYNYFPNTVHRSLEILEQAGYIIYNVNPDNRSRVMFLLSREDLYRLKNVNKYEEDVINILLRNYGGLFVDFAYIDEAFIAMKANMSRQQVYTTLKNLANQHIIRFVPRRDNPSITYKRDRIESEKLIIGEDIYEKRKVQYVERINKILEYATNDDECRSKMLLRYFGEEDKDDCKMCDICIGKYNKKDFETGMEKAKQAIIDMLSDKQRHHVTELQSLNLPTDCLDEALRILTSEEEIKSDYGWLYL